jgi:cell wall-associated NlpC family hydrolase
MSIAEVMSRISEIQARMNAPLGGVPIGYGAVQPNGTTGMPSTQGADFASTLAALQAREGQVPGAASLTGTLPGADPAAPAPADNGAFGQKMVDFATKYVGVPYVAGGDTPQTGWDCAGFTQWVAKQQGLDIPPVSWEQIKVGQPVASLADAKPGDLVFFHEPGGHRHDPSPLGVNHVGMYLGGGKMVEAANPSAGTRIGDVDQAKLVGIRRIAG